VMNQAILAKPCVALFPLLFSLALYFLFTRTSKLVICFRMVCCVIITLAATIYCGFAYLTTSSWYKEWKFLALNENEKFAILEQEQVEVIFWGDGFGYLPRSRMELLCNQQTGKLVVTPHTNSNKAAMIDQDGKVSSIELGSEAPDKSISIGLYVVSAVSHKIILIDMEMATSADMRGKKYPLNLLDIDIDDQSFFGKWIPSLSPFNQLRVDFQQRKFYIPAMYRGKIFIFDLNTLECISSFEAHVGVRNVLIDKNNLDRVYAWNYATSEVIEHQLPEGRQLRSWKLGPILRTLNWDCNQQDLLATTAVGGFRIHLN